MLLWYQGESDSFFCTPFSDDNNEQEPDDQSPAFSAVISAAAITFALPNLTGCSSPFLKTARYGKLTPRIEAMNHMLGKDSYRSDALCCLAETDDRAQSGRMGLSYPGCIMMEICQAIGDG